MRRTLELQAVVQHFTPLVVLLRRPFTHPALNDGEVVKAFEWACYNGLPVASLHNNFPPDHIAEKIRVIVDNLNKEL